VCHVVDRGSTCEILHVCQVFDVLVSVLGSDSGRSRCPPLTANILLYIAELFATVKIHCIPLLPLCMPAVITVASDLSFLMRFVVFAAFVRSLSHFRLISVSFDVFEFLICFSFLI